MAGPIRGTCHSGRAARFNADLAARLVIALLNDLHDPRESIYSEMRAKPHLYGVARPLSEAEARELLEKEVKRFNEEKRTLLKNEMKAELGKLELSVAVLGTLLWGFADLVNRFYACR